MADIQLGKIEITINQLKRADSLKSEFIKGFSLWEDGSVVVVSTIDLSDEEKDDLVKSLKNLPNSKLKSRLDELQEKNSPTLSEVVEALKLKGIL